MLMAAYKIKWVAGYFISSTLEFFLYKAVIHRVYSVICFLLNPGVGGDVNKVNSQLFRLSSLFAGGWVGPGVQSLEVSGCRGAVTGRGLIWIQDSGKEGEGWKDKRLGTRACWQIWYGTTEQNIKNNSRIANSRVIVVQSLCRVWLCNSKDCNTLAPGVCSNSCPLSRWCYLTISSSVAPFFSYPLNLSQH